MSCLRWLGASTLSFWTSFALNTSTQHWTLLLQVFVWLMYTVRIRGILVKPVLCAVCVWFWQNGHTSTLKFN